MTDILNDAVLDKLESALTESEKTFGAGDLIDGRFKVGKSLGRGNFAFTYLVQDKTDKVLYALKTIYPRLTKDEKTKTVLIGALEDMVALDHPNLGQVAHVGKHDDLVYFTTEYIKAPTLEKAIATNRAKALKTGSGIPRKQIDIIVNGIKKGLEAAGIPHLDLAPGNVFITKAGAKVMDAGIFYALRPGQKMIYPCCTKPNIWPLKFLKRKEKPGTRRMYTAWGKYFH